MNNLTPEIRADVNGKLVTRHVRADSKKPSSSLSMPPVLNTRIDTMKRIARSIKILVADSGIRDDLELEFNAVKLISNLHDLSDVELERFGLYLHQTEEISGAFLIALDKGDTDFLSDMTLIFNGGHHAGTVEDSDESQDGWGGWGDYTPSPEGIFNEIRGDRNGMKKYVESKGFSYTKIDDLDTEARALATKWMSLRCMVSKFQVDAVATKWLPRETTDDEVVTIVEFLDPEFLEAAMQDESIIDIAKEHGTADMNRLKFIMSHEKALTKGVL